MITQICGEKRALLFPAKSQSDKFVLFLTGFPKYPASNNFIDFFVENDYNVLCPLYTGTFDSAGDFSINNCIEDVRDWFNFIKRGEYFLGPQRPKQEINASKIMFFSHSFGSYILDLSLRKYDFKGVEKMMFISPLSRPNNHQTQESGKISKTTEEMVARNYPLSYRFGNKSEFFGEIAGDVINPLSSEKIKSSKLKALVLVGDQDQVTPKEMATSLAQDYPGSILKVTGGGHSSSIDFVEVSKLIEEFI